MDEKRSSSDSKVARELWTIDDVGKTGRGSLAYHQSCERAKIITPRPSARLFWPFRNFGDIATLVIGETTVAVRHVQKLACPEPSLSLLLHPLGAASI